MSTVPQTIANQQNALKSTGPVTAQGKEASSRNATTHGLTATRVLASEAPSFEQFLRDFTIQLKPETDTERGLVRRCAEYQVRIDRTLEAETTILNDYMAMLKQLHPGISESDVLAKAMRDKQCAWELRLVLRYHGQCTRAYRQTRQEVEQMIAARREAEELAAVAAHSAAAARPVHTAQPSETKPAGQNGFVSQNPLPPSAAASSASASAPRPTADALRR